MNTIIRIQTPALLSFGQFFKKKTRFLKGQSKLQGFWFSTYFFGYL